MYELTGLAFMSDSTRVATFSWVGRMAKGLMIYSMAVGLGKLMH